MTRGARGATPRETVPQAERHRLRYEKAEAKARYNEGQRLARHRNNLTQEQVEVLRQWDTNELLRNRNSAIVAHGHGRLRTARGDYLDIGGSTGGGSRRIIDGWKPPDWQEFLQDE